MNIWQYNSSTLLQLFEHGNVDPSISNIQHISKATFLETMKPNMTKAIDQEHFFLNFLCLTINILQGQTIAYVAIEAPCAYILLLTK